MLAGMASPNKGAINKFVPAAMRRDNKGEVWIWEEANAK
jgi:hypothetical protein